MNLFIYLFLICFRPGLMICFRPGSEMIETQGSSFLVALRLMSGIELPYLKQALWPTEPIEMIYSHFNDDKAGYITISVLIASFWAIPRSAQDLTPALICRDHSCWCLTLYGIRYQTLVGICKAAALSSML